jgi:hypothetical protein
MSAQEVPVPKTARKHFDEDFARAAALLSVARVFEDTVSARSGTPDPTAVRAYNDMRLSAIAMTAGAMDAYFCDAYEDCLSSTLAAFVKQTWMGRLPSHFAKQLLPAGELLDSSRQKRPMWNIRMAARRVMERADMYAISKIETHFNGILPPGQKIWGGFLPSLLSYEQRRLTGPKSFADLNALSGEDRDQAIKDAASAVKRRIGGIVQVRHDWIHNCGRPKYAIQTFTHGEAQSRIRHVGILVREFDDHIEKHRLA